MSAINQTGGITVVKGYVAAQRRIARCACHCGAIEALAAIGGRRAQKANISELARKHSQEAIERLAKIMTTSRSEQARIMAANSLLDRAWESRRSRSPETYRRKDFSEDASGVLSYSGQPSFRASTAKGNDGLAFRFALDPE